MLPRPIQLLPAVLLLVAGVAAARAESDAYPSTTAAEIVVHVSDGRVHSGLLAPETDDAGLRLETRFGEGRILRRIDWEQIVRVAIAGNTCSGGQLRQAWMALYPAAAARRGERRYGVTGPTPDAAGGEAAGGPRDPVRCLAVDADLGRWDAHVESSGLVLRIMPCDAAGQLAPVDGTLMVELVTGPQEPLDKQPFSRIGYWQQAVRVADFDARGAQYRLSFQAVHPEFAYLPALHAAVHVRLSVPGQGTFDATQDGVCLRPHFTPVRDFLEQPAAGGAPRFLPGERTGRR